LCPLNLAGVQRFLIRGRMLIFSFHIFTRKRKCFYGVSGFFFPDCRVMLISNVLDIKETIR
jgi:hypothetical protein